MPDKRYLHLNLVANDINLHQGAYKYEQAQAIPERSTFERLIEYGRFGDEGLFTALFVGDIPGLNGSPAFDGGPAEPITALTAIAEGQELLGASVEDLRTGATSTSPGDVLDGDLDDFMAAALAQRVTGEKVVVEDVD